MRTHNLGLGILGVLSGLLLAGGGLVHTSQASADFAWCWDDPLVLIDGLPQAITIGLQPSDLAALNGTTPVVVTLYLAQNHTAVIPAVQPVGAFPVVTQVVTTGVSSPSSGLTVAVVLTVTATHAIPVRMDLLNVTGVHTVLTGSSSQPLLANFTPRSLSFGAVLPWPTPGGDH